MAHSDRDDRKTAENDRTRRERSGEDAVPQPSEEHDDGMIGSTDERSSENRRKGLEKDRERAKDDEPFPETGG